jgi:hypothetical protein
MFLLEKKMLEKKKTCTGVKIFSAKISGKCSVTGALFIGNFQKNDGNCNDFQRTTCIIFPTLMMSM